MAEPLPAERAELQRIGYHIQAHIACLGIYAPSPYDDGEPRCIAEAPEDEIDWLWDQAADDLAAVRKRFGADTAPYALRERTVDLIGAGIAALAERTRGMLSEWLTRAGVSTHEDPTVSWMASRTQTELKCLLAALTTPSTPATGDE